jgi:hypothetical protein
MLATMIACATDATTGLSPISPHTTNDGAPSTP